MYCFGKEGKAMMLLGTHTPTIDAQYRISFPAKFRTLLGEEFLIVRHLENPCLRFYSLTEWEKYLERLESYLDQGDLEDVLEYYYSDSVNGTPDSLGRVRIPKELWKCIDVDPEDEDAKQIVVTGCGKYGEIWRKSAYEAHKNSRRTAELNAKVRACPSKAKNDEQ